jgi:predicted ribosome quality control (RQC) complex YloA/Tae2 family protein
MDLNHLTDDELMDHIIRYDSDPIRVKLATVMQRTKGAIIDDLVYAGMDETFCDFRSVVNAGKYHPGEYIRHLENEIEYLEDRLIQERKEIENLKARTVADLINELNQQIETEKYNVRVAREYQQKAEKKAEEATHKLDMWAILQR